MFTNIFSSFCLFLFIFLLSIQSTSALSCYECNNCIDISSCTCDNLVDTKNSYCILLRETLETGVNIEVKHVPRDSTPYYIYDPHYISVEEIIFYNDTTERWFSKSNKIIFACQTDQCNKASLLQQLPSTGLSLMLPSDWLNGNILRKQDKNMTICYQCEESICSDATHTVNMSTCVKKNDCQGSCMMTEIYNQGDTRNFCYSSFCTDESSQGPNPMSPEIIITAVYYINDRQFDVVELDVICNGDDCSRLQIFEDIKNKLEKDLTGIRGFLPNHVNSIYSTSIIYLIMILLQMIMFY